MIPFSMRILWYNEEENDFIRGIMMNFINRALLAIKRNLGKYSLLLGAVLILGSLASGAISIQRAIQRTEERLLSQLPTVATLAIDNWAVEEFLYETDQHPRWEFVSSQMIREIGDLPYVSAFDYSFPAGFSSLELVRYINQFPNPDWGVTSSEIIDWGSWSSPNAEGQVLGGLESFGLSGIHNYELVDVESGLIRLVEGRAFAEEEIMSELPVVIVSQGFASVNGLEVGSIFTLNNFIFSIPIEGVWETSELMEHLLYHQEIEVEIIGLFEIIPQINADTQWQNVQWTQNMLNQIYAPNGVVQQMIDFYNEARSQIFEDFVPVNWVEPLFLLNDPRDLRAFSEAASDILPDFWRIEDLSGNLDSVFASLETLNWLADIILFTGVGATVTITTLLTLLFLKDRTHEIGLYLALGERKSHIMGQLLIELLSVAMISLSLSLFIGNGMSEALSRMMLTNDLLQQEEEIPWIVETTPPNLAWHNPGEMGIEEMFEMYDTTLDMPAVLIFYGLGVGAVLIAGITSIGSALRQNPKKILM